MQKLEAALSKEFRICFSRRSLGTLAVEGFRNDSEGGKTLLEQHDFL
ncbi:hypothetical protein FOFC_18492 [Fusarium oxysporum]|jgi:hypothetical protein|nr:hypothetical protein FOFC_18492 [Fusarium oxysporum]